MARFFVFAIAVSSVDGSCSGSEARCSCDNSYNDKILGMHSHLLGKITKPVKEWKVVDHYPNKNNPGPRPVKLSLSYGHSKTQSTTWSVGIGAVLKEIGINMDADLAQMKSETWTEGVSEDIATSVKPYHSLNLYQKVFHQTVTWARRVDGGNDIKDCGGTYSFKSNIYQFSPTQPKADSALSNSTIENEIVAVASKSDTTAAAVASLASSGHTSVLGGSVVTEELPPAANCFQTCDCSCLVPRGVFHPFQIKAGVCRCQGVEGKEVHQTYCCRQSDILV